MKFRTKIFDPSCTSVTTMMDAHKLIGKAAGLNEQPCLKASLGLTCRCCLQFEVVGYGGTTFDPSSPYFDDATAFCTGLFAQTVTLAPDPDTLQPANNFCTWYETEESMAVRGSSNFYVTPPWRWSASWGSAFGFHLFSGYETGTGSGHWGSFISSPPCMSKDPIAAVFVPDVGSRPFLICEDPDGMTNHTINVRAVKCDGCKNNMARYRAEYPNTMWTLTNSNCKSACPTGSCRPPTPEELHAEHGDIPWRGIPTDPPVFAVFSCRCDDL